MTAKEYQAAVKQSVPHSKTTHTVPLAFLVGGLLCVLGQAVIMVARSYGLDESVASACGSIALILLSALLTGLNVYDNLAKYAGAGTLVPITGFANSMVSPAMEFKSEGYILGLGAKTFSIAGPVLVYGISSSIVYGIIYYFFVR